MHSMAMVTWYVEVPPSRVDMTNGSQPNYYSLTVCPFIQWRKRQESDMWYVHSHGGIQCVIIDGILEW